MPMKKFLKDLFQRAREKGSGINKSIVNGTAVKKHLEDKIKMLETGNSTVTPVVSNLRIHPALVDGYLPSSHFFLPP